MIPEEIFAGARTVIGVAEHFVDLKQTAFGMFESYVASNRGYFTPTEDEEVRHLLISYWQSRNALIELVVSFRDDEHLTDETRPTGFLVAYAGALVLVDAARFLRLYCEDRPIVRAKLNEPEPSFGIEAGTYDRIQKSLTSPVHAWHLYHAAQYFDDHQRQLQELAQDDLLAPLLIIIERLQATIKVGISEYATARAKVRTQKMVETVRRDLLSRAMYGLQKAVSRLLSEMSTSPGHQPGLPTSVAQQLRDVLQPGDVLITRKEHALTNYFLPGFWPHAALYLGNRQQLEAFGISNHANVQPRWARLLDCDQIEPGRVLEALKDGVWIRSLACPFASDALAVIRPRLKSADISEAITRGLFHEGKPYDFDFDFTRSDRLVCTEVVYRSYEGVGGLSFGLTKRAGRLTLAAEDLMGMALDRIHFDPVAVYARDYGKTLLLGESAERVMRETKAE